MNIRQWMQRSLLGSAVLLSGIFCRSEEIALVAGKAPAQKIQLSLAAPPDMDEIVRLKFSGRMIGDVNSGWGYSVELTMNGKKIGRLTRSGDQRLLNREPELVSKEKGRIVHSPYFKNYGDAIRMLLFSAPADATATDVRAQSDREQGFEYILDVSDLVAAGSNTLELSTPLAAPNTPGKETRLLFRNIVLEAVPAPSAAEPDWEFEAVFPQSRKVNLVTGDKTTSEALTFPAIKPRRDTAIVLHVDARLVTPGFSGWNPWFAIRLNGKQLNRNTAAGEQRLLKRGSFLETKVPGSEKMDWWGWFGGKMTLMTFFAPPNTREMDPRIVAPRNEGYDYYLDVTDCVNFLEIGADERVEKDAPNQLEVLLHLTRGNIGGKELTLAVRGINFLYVPKSAIAQMRNLQLKKFTAKTPVAEIAAKNSQLKVAADGSMEVLCGGESFVLSSQFSYPASPKMKYNFFGEGSSHPEWRPAVRQLNSQTIQVSAAMPEYKVERTVRIDGAVYRVTDQITNTAPDDLGMAIWVAMGGNTVTPGRFRLAGQTGVETVSFFSVSNPSMFVPGKQTGLGAVAEDAVSRAQLEMQGKVNEVLMGTAGVGLRKGSILKREWTIYPVLKPDYFTFINAVRRDWGANYTLPGPCSFSYDPSETALRSGVVMIPPWFEYDLGKGMSRADYMKTVQPRIAAAKAEFGEKTFIMPRLECNLVPLDCSKFAWGDAIPQRSAPRNTVSKGGAYGVFLSREVTAKLDRESPYRDSVIRNAEGCAMFDSFYPEKPWVHLMVQPETGNHRLKTLLEAIDFMLDKVGFNSIYIDQFNPYTIGGFSDDRWDGYTVKLDESGRIAARRYSYAITGKEARAEILRRVTNRGGVVLTNGQPMSKEELFPGHLAFQEMENDDVNPLPFMETKPPEFRWESASHLGTPIALGLRPARFDNLKKRPNRCAEIQFKGLIIALRNGVNYYIYTSEMPKDHAEDAGSFDVYNHLYPFTPVELNEGWLIGKERTITACSGSFHVKGSARPACFRFGSRGQQEEESGFAVSGQPGDWTVDVKLKDWCEVGVVEVRNN